MSVEDWASEEGKKKELLRGINESKKMGIISTGDKGPLLVIGEEVIELGWACKEKRKDSLQKGWRQIQLGSFNVHMSSSKSQFRLILNLKWSVRVYVWQVKTF